MEKLKRLVGLAIALLAVVLIAAMVRGIAKPDTQPKNTQMDTTAASTLQESAPKTQTAQTTSASEASTSTAMTQTAPATTTTVSPTGETTRPPSTTASAAANGYMYNYPGINPKPAVINNDKWHLILVNRSYFITEDYPVVLKPAVKGVNEDFRLDERVAPLYNRMYTDALKTGNRLTPLSGHRRFSTQKTNYENRIRVYQNQGMAYADAVLKAAESIMPPGCSEHHTGLAMDIANINASFQYSNEYKWLKENAAEYGFILRYPADKTHITKVKYEPWHWRYVGVEVATAMNASGQCLEEYLGMVG